MRYVCECRKHKVLGLLWFELVNARGCNGEEDEAGDAKGATAVPHFCSRRPPSPPALAAEHGFYFVKVDSVFFYFDAATAAGGSDYLHVAANYLADWNAAAAGFEARFVAKCEIFRSRSKSRAKRRPLLAIRVIESYFFDQ